MLKRINRNGRYNITYNLHSLALQFVNCVKMNFESGESSSSFVTVTDVAAIFALYLIMTALCILAIVIEYLFIAVKWDP